MSKYYIIDSHCHIYPEKVVDRAVAGTDRFYGLTKSACVGTVADLMREGSDAGIDHFIVQSVATSPKQVSSINRFIADSVARSDGKMTGLGTLHPESEDIAGDVEQILALGLKGVKLHPDIQGFKIDDYRCLRIYELCEGKLPILMHTGDRRYDFSNPNRLRPILETYTGLTVIGAHLGGYSIWQEACEKLHGIPNLYVDCSSSLPLVSPEDAVRMIRTYGTDRVLFGTDYPMWKPKTEVSNLLSLGLTDAEYRMIFSENAKKVYQIDPEKAKNTESV